MTVILSWAAFDAAARTWWCRAYGYAASIAHYQIFSGWFQLPQGYFEFPFAGFFN
jgi:hypothetical protein